jgi:4-hydroxy-3-methylbut-2-enyl diphosphate reductase
LQVKIAERCGFCFGVKRAIKLAEENKNSMTLGPLIHNKKEINRLENNFNVKVANSLDNIKDTKSVIIRTHGIEKDKLEILKNSNLEITDATCPYVMKLQQISEKMSNEGYDVIIFGDNEHPEVKGVKSYVKNPVVVLNIEDLKRYKLKDKIAIVAQTTRKNIDYNKIINYLLQRYKEIRVFNTICNATFENQDSARELSKNVDIMVVIGGKNSSNTKQLLTISLENCSNSYLVEDVDDLNKEWFINKKICGITAGASTPDWIIKKIISVIEDYEL